MFNRTHGFKKFAIPALKHSNIHDFARLTDPRLARSKRHALGDILIISVGVLLSGAEGFGDTEESGHAQRDWLSRLLELPDGIPCHDAFGRVFAALEKAEEAGFCADEWRPDGV